MMNIQYQFYDIKDYKNDKIKSNIQIYKKFYLLQIRKNIDTFKKHQSYKIRRRIIQLSPQSIFSIIISLIRFRMKRMISIYIDSFCMYHTQDTNVNGILNGTLWIMEVLCVCTLIHSILVEI